MKNLHAILIPLLFVSFSKIAAAQTCKWGSHHQAIEATKKEHREWKDAKKSWQFGNLYKCKFYMRPPANFQKGLEEIQGYYYRNFPGSMNAVAENGWIKVQIIGGIEGIDCRDHGSYNWRH